jgi:hypothetical protein
MDDARRLNAQVGPAHGDSEALFAGRLLRVSVLLLVVAAGAWICGSAWWTAQSVGPTRWLGGIIEVFGFLGSLGAVGMIWYALRWKRATGALNQYLQDEAVFGNCGCQPLSDRAGGPFGWMESTPGDA